PRSAVGARLAVETFRETALAFAGFARGKGTHDPSALPQLMHHARNTLPQLLVRDWQQAVLEHWARDRGQAVLRPETGSTDGDAAPPAPSALPVEAEAEPTDQEKVRLYGATVIGALLTPELFVAWQLGDGELTVLASDGTPVLPLAPEGAQMGDETES